MTIGRESYKRYRCALAALVMITIFATANAIAGPETDYWSYSLVSNNLFRTDTTTGVTTSLATSIRPWGLTFTPDGNLWTSTSSFNNLGMVDQNSGAITTIGNYSTRISSIASNQSGMLFGYGYDNKNLYQINTSTGDATSVGNTSITGLVDLAFDATTNTMWGLSEVQSVGTKLYTIDTTTGAGTFVTFVKTGSGNNAIQRGQQGGGIAFDATGALFLLDTGSPNFIYNLNKNTGDVTFQVNTHSEMVLRGGTFGPQSVPLPTTVLMGLVGFGVVLVVRRRYFR